MAEAQYTPNDLVEGFHDLPHYNLKFKAVSNRFDPQNTEYLQSLAQFAIPFALLANLFLLGFIISYCCCHKNREKKKYTPTSLRRLQIGVILVAVMSCAAIAVSFTGNSKISTGSSNFLRAVTDLDTIFAGIVDEVESLSTLAEQTAQEADRVTVPTTQRGDLDKFVEYVSTGGVELSNIVVSARGFDLQFLNDDIEKYNKIREDVTWAFAAVIAVIGVATLIAAVVKSSKLLKLSALFLVFGFYLCWMLSAVQFTISVGAADFCIDPSDYVIRTVNNEVTTYYIQCNPTTSLPYSEYLKSFDDAIGAASTLLNPLGNFIPRDTYDDLFGKITVLNTTVANVSVKLECIAPNSAYQNAVKAVCNDSVQGLVTLLISFSVTGLLFIIVCLLIKHLWAYYDPRFGYYAMGSDGRMSSEDAPLMGSSPSYGSSSF